MSDQSDFMLECSIAFYKWTGNTSEIETPNFIPDETQQELKRRCTQEPPVNTSKKMKDPREKKQGLFYK